MADLPNLDNTKDIFVGQVTAIGQPVQVHGMLLQDVTYQKVEVKMGLKTYFKDPMTVPHTVDSNSSALPTDLFKVGNTLVVGMVNFNVPNYVHRADQATLQAIHKALEALVEKLVVAYLKEHNFDLTLVMDGKNAFLDGDLLPLDQIVEKSYRDVHDKVGDASEGSDDNVRKYVEEYYQDRKSKLSSDWQVTIQVGQAPQIPFWASRPQPPGTLGSWQQGQQLTLGIQSSQAQDGSTRFRSARHFSTTSTVRQYFLMRLPRINFLMPGCWETRYIPRVLRRTGPIWSAPFSAKLDLVLGITALTLIVGTRYTWV